MITDKELFEKLWPQTSGEYLKVIELSPEVRGKKRLFECEFQKYPFTFLATKDSIVRGQVLNPRIEQIEFIEKEWPQNCGDSLKIVKKTNIIRSSKYLWEAEFKKYPYKVITTKDLIIKGRVDNPLIEQKEFIEKLWPQNCGDILRILKKTNQRKKGSTIFLWECEFQKYPYKIYCEKSKIIKGEILNPLIEQKEFIEKFWPQNCGDYLKIIEKTNIKLDRNLLWKVQFQKYPCELLALKSSILNGSVDNPNLPWKHRNDLELFLKKYGEKGITIYELSQKLNLSTTKIGRCIREFNLEKYIKYFVSYQEQNIKDFISNLGLNCLNQTFGKELDFKELDIFIKEKNIAVEYNGNVWHSTKFKESNYHQEKSLLFKDKLNISIIHIFEYEWNSKQDIIKSILKSRLGFFDKIIYARKCIIKELNNQEYQQFCEENHLQGSAGAKIKLGLFYENELIQIMSFSLPRFTDRFDWEIIRECSKLNCKIIGGKEKLWSYFVQKENPKNCISYCDFSKFTGNSYLKLGFQKERRNPPGFVWYDEQNNQVFWRNPYKNQELKEKGYYKIYDAGQLVFTWQKG